MAPTMVIMQPHSAYVGAARLPPGRGRSLTHHVVDDDGATGRNAETFLRTVGPRIPVGLYGMHFKLRHVSNQCRYFHGGGRA